MPWFRWLKKSTDTSAEQTAAPHEESAPAPAEVPDVADLEHEQIEGEGAAAEVAAETESEADAARRKRRRGSRGGRRRKPAGEGAEAPATAAEPAGEERAAPQEGARERRKGEQQQQRRRSGSGSSQQRRKQAPRRMPLPAARRELLISVDVGEQRVAVVEDGQVAEVYLERPESRSIVGNIYLGTVDNVLPGMEAAFVEIGLEKNGFLYVDEIVVPELEGKRHGKKIQDLISRGEKILVQAVKDPMKTKGARLTTEISLPGRFLVLVPNGEGLGVSRRLDDAERQRLKDILKPIAPKEGGVIVRTAAEGASAEDVERDLVFLERLWKTIQARSAGAKAPELVYQEAELPLRIVRDLFAGDFVSAQVDNERTFKRIVGYLKKTSPHMVERVHRWKEKERLFEQAGVEREIASTLDRRVDLPSGGYLIFDYAEAFTVIDVNTGRFVGSRSKSSTQRLEDTIVKNNLEAVKEVVRQLRLRDIGGIIVIDFIDMANPKNRQAVEEALRTELERDRTKTYVVEISPLGLVEMTRQNVTDGPREVMTRKCPTCAGDGIVVSDQTVAMRVERRLRELAAAGAGSRVQAYRVALHPHTVALLAGPGGRRLAALEEVTRRRFFLVPVDGVPLDHVEVLAEGKLDDLRPASPVEEGAELEVKLVEVGLHDATVGVAKVDGIDVVVDGAGRLVGKKARVSVGRVLDGQAFALLVAATEEQAPITFESEAEKPTRAPARRKATGGEAEAEPSEPEVGAAPAPGEAEVEVEVDREGDEATGEEAEPGEEGAAAKRKTRRGSRGGRRRKKRPAGEPTEAELARGEAAVELAPAGDEVVESEVVDAPAEVEAPTKPSRPRAPGGKRTPRIHVPEDRDRAPAEAGETAVVTADAAPAQVAGVEEQEPAGDEQGASAEAAEGTSTRKRTRRGSRGGRGRRKKPDSTTEVDDDHGDETPAEVPADENGSAAGDGGGAESAETAAAPRRSSSRRRRPATAPEPAEDGGTVAADASSQDEPAPAEGYVPMSEWIDDFERRG